MTTELIKTKKEKFEDTLRIVKKWLTTDNYFQGQTQGSFEGAYFDANEYLMFMQLDSFLREGFGKNEEDNEFYDEYRKANVRFMELILIKYIPEPFKFSTGEPLIWDDFFHCDAVETLVVNNGGYK